MGHGIIISHQATEQIEKEQRSFRTDKGATKPPGSPKLPTAGRCKVYRVEGQGSSYTSYLFLRVPSHLVVWGV